MLPLVLPSVGALVGASALVANSSRANRATAQTLGGLGGAFIGYALGKRIERQRSLGTPYCHTKGAGMDYRDYYLAGEEAAEVAEAQEKVSPLVAMSKGYITAGQAYMRAAWPVVLIGGLILAYSVSPKGRK